VLEVANRKDKAQYVIRNPAKAEQQAGQLVAAHLLQSTKKGRQEVEIERVLGDPNDSRAISLIALHANEIPDKFPEAVLKEAEKNKKRKWDPRLRGVDGSFGRGLSKSVMPAACRAEAAKQRRGRRASHLVLKNNEQREDLRDLPLVTIDGPDSRDFDDAVFAEKDGTGWHIVVAIADVAHYVTPDNALDREAQRRGNSTYFPDRVVPMLPEVLSNDLCSLMPNVERLCLAAHMWLDGEGELVKWRFVRGVMKSHARLTYEQVQAAKDGAPDATTKPLMKNVIARFTARMTV
jgi:ribonuclease R